jgi:hypothetical protein
MVVASNVTRKKKNVVARAKLEKLGGEMGTACDAPRQ